MVQGIIHDDTTMPTHSVFALRLLGLSPGIAVLLLDASVLLCVVALAVMLGWRRCGWGLWQSCSEGGQQWQHSCVVFAVIWAVSGSGAVRGLLLVMVLV
jgi:hypothetical protein